MLPPIKLCLAFFVFLYLQSIASPQDGQADSHRIRKKADLVAQLYIQHASLMDVQKAKEYVLIRRLAEADWHTVFTSVNDTTDSAQATLDAVTRLATWCSGRLTPLSNPKFVPTFNDADKGTWGRTLPSGEILIGKKAISGSASQLFATVVHELFHAEEYERLRLAELESTKRTTRQDALSELAAESRAAAFVKHVFSDGNAVTADTLRYSKKYLEDWAKELVDGLIKDKSYDSYRRSVELARTGAPGLIYGGLLLDDVVSRCRCSHGSVHEFRGFQLCEGKNGDVYLAISTECTERAEGCNCPPMNVIKYRPWCQEDLWAAWHILYPTETMKSAASLKGGEDGLVSIKGGYSSDFSIHPALSVVDIGQHALWLDQKLSEVLRAAPELFEHDSGNPVAWVKVGDNESERRARIDFAKLDAILGDASSLRLCTDQGIDVSPCLELGNALRDTRSSVQCYMPVSQVLSMSRALIGMQWRDSSIGELMVNNRGEVTASNVDLYATGFTTSSTSIATLDGSAALAGSLVDKRIALAALEIANNPELDVMPLSLTLALHPPIEWVIPRDDWGLRRVQSGYSFARVKHFAGTLAVLRGLAKGAASDDDLSWPIGKPIETCDNQMLATQASRNANPEVFRVMSDIACPEGDFGTKDGGEEIRWVRLGDQFFGSMQKKTGKDAGYWYTHVNSDSAWFVARQSESTGLQRIRAMQFNWNDLLRSSHQESSVGINGRVPVYLTSAGKVKATASDAAQIEVYGTSVMLNKGGKGSTLFGPTNTPIVLTELRYLSLWPLIKQLKSGKKTSVAAISMQSPTTVKNNFSLISRGLKKSQVLDYETLEVTCSDSERRVFEIAYSRGLKERILYSDAGIPQIIKRYSERNKPEHFSVMHVGSAEVLRLASTTLFESRLLVAKYDNRIERSFGVCELELEYDGDCTDCRVGENLDQLWTVVRNDNGRVVIRSSKTWRGILTGSEVGDASAGSTLYSYLGATQDSGYDKDVAKAGVLPFDGTWVEDWVKEQSVFSGGLMAAGLWHGWVWDEREPQPCAVSDIARRRRGVCYHQAHLLASMLRGRGMLSTAVDGVVAGEGSHLAVGHCWIQYLSVKPKLQWVQVDQTNLTSRLVYIPSASKRANLKSIRFLNGSLAESVGLLSQLAVDSVKKPNGSCKEWFERGYAAQRVVLAAYEDGDSLIAALKKFKSIGQCSLSIDPSRFLMSIGDADPNVILRASVGSLHRDIAAFYGRKASAAFSLGALVALGKSWERHGETGGVGAQRQKYPAILGYLLTENACAVRLCQIVDEKVQALGGEAGTFELPRDCGSVPALKRRLQSLENMFREIGCITE